MEMLPGIPCPSPIWVKNPPKENLSRTIADFAAINVHRANNPLPFRVHGTLRCCPGEIDTWIIGPLNHHILISEIPPHLPARFRTAAEKWTTIYDLIIDGIVRGCTYIVHREKAFLIHRWIRDCVAAYPRYQEEGETYILHEDAKGDTIMVDEQGKITGLIDWEKSVRPPLIWLGYERADSYSATAASKWEVFAAPMALFDNHMFFNGINDLCSAEIELCENYVRLGRPDLVDCVKEGKVFQRLHWLADNGVREWSDYRQLRGLGLAFGLEMPETMEVFMEAQMAKYGHELDPLPAA